MKRLLSLFLLVCLLIAVPLSLSSCGGDGNTVVIEVKNYGTIVVELKPEAAPKTVENFKKLVSEGFYNGCSFYRIATNFVIQGGGYYTRPKDTVEGEFAANGYDNPIEHVRGVISMARSTSYNSASSEFFIVTTTSASVTRSLDGLYAGFGYVVSGMDVVDKIAATRKIGETPLADIIITRMYLK